ncbi:alpha/beta fold hydrolase [Nocardia sp. NPDC059180]|uniref:alpha/beta fold hydrolase n=1 Tax=Nocardia sp. NPDC059180 TaxID=3346761 RepID=UPI0036CB5951
MKSATLPVPGATLHYEVRGSGPLLLMIPGGGGDAGVFDEMAEVLARRCTMVAFDPRGYSRSPQDGEPQDRQVAVQADDAYRLLTHVTDEPAYVFGTSAGAVVCLELLARYPDSVRTLLAHEPPCFEVLADAATHRTMIGEVRSLFRTDGVGPAMARFVIGIGGTLTPPPDFSELPPHIRELRARLAENMPAMVEHELKAITSYQPDFAALAASADRLTLAVGRDSGSALSARPAAAIADRLGLEVAEFPGDHNGIRTEANSFAEQLIEAFMSRC